MSFLYFKILESMEFQMFCSSLCAEKDGTVWAAEAVSAGIIEKKGLLYPGSYIELLEAEGTIAELDFYFEEVCRQWNGGRQKDGSCVSPCNFVRITIGRESLFSKSKRFLNGMS